MRRRLFLLLAAALALSAAASRVSRASIATLEKSFDRRLERDVLDSDPFLLLGMTRGVYIEGFGVVYSTEVNLAPIPGISPFHPELTKDDLARLRQKKLARLPALKQAMKQMLLDTAASLDGVPREENIALAVSLFRHPREDATGIPAQILMQALKRELLEFQTGKRDKARLDSVIRLQEF
jgi:hypothetical protein